MNLPVDFENSLQSLSKLYYNTYDNDDDDDFDIFKQFAQKNYELSYLDKTPSSVINEIKEKYSYYLSRFVREQKHSIPSLILPKKYTTGYITDVDAFINPKEKKSLLRNSTMKKYEVETDDYVYSNYPQLQQYIPRGLAIYEIYENETEEKEFFDIGVYANKKFTGMTKQDDDDKVDINKFCIEDINKNTDKLITMEKVNGEAFHVAGRYIKDNFYYFIGSKKSHIMIQHKDDIHLYQAERLKNTKKFATSFMNFLNCSLSLDKIEILKNLLHYTKCTMVYEILQPSYQHIVPIDEIQDKFVFLMFSSPYNNNATLTAFPPHIANKVIRVLNIETAQYNIHDSWNLDKIIKDTRMDNNTEGIVLYYLNKNNQTICLLKLKTFWYIFLRALRMKANYFIFNKEAATILNNEQIKTSINKKFDDISKDFQYDDEPTLQYYKDKAFAFIKWVKSSQNNTKFKTSFPILWREFCKLNP